MKISHWIRLFLFPAWIWVAGCQTSSTSTPPAEPPVPAPEAESDEPASSGEDAAVPARDSGGALDLPKVSTYGAVRSVEAPDAAVRLEIDAADNENPWDSGAVWNLGAAFEAGDKLRITFSARAWEDPEGEGIPVMLELADPPYTKLLRAMIQPGVDFSPVLLEARVDAQTESTPLNLTLHLGGAEGALDLRNLQVIRVTDR